MCNDKPAKGGWRYKIKYVIWIVWMISIVVTYIMGKNDFTIDPFFMTDHGISIHEICDFIVYYGVMLLLVIPSLIHGKRATCHYFCWMAPFWVIGRTIGRFLHLPQLHIEAEPSDCISCGKCSSSCPMGLDVKEMVSLDKISKCTECINCGACIDACPKKVLKYKLKWKR